MILDFRVRDIETEKIINADFVIDRKGELILLLKNQVIATWKPENEERKVELFIRQLDSNDNDIYEADVLVDQDGIKYQVIWVHHSSSFNLQQLEAPKNIESCEGIENLTIIGSIYDDIHK